MATRHFGSAALLFTLVTAAAAFAADPEPTDSPPVPEGEQIQWTNGPSHVDLGRDIAQLELPEGFAFAGAEDAKDLLRSMGNRPSGNELGLLIPTTEGQDWFIVFAWQNVGYVKDDEKDDIDADALLESITEATDAANDWRRENGIPTLRVTGWAEAPRYDEGTNNLVWATLAEDEGGGKSTNFNMRYLGRHGLVSATLVESAELLPVSKPLALAALKDFSFKPGSKYAEWQKGDKVAEYGLTALVAAGAGAAAVKLGFFGLLAKFFAKSAKLVIVGGVALLAGLGKLWGAITGRKNQE